MNTLSINQLIVGHQSKGKIAFSTHLPEMTFQEGQLIAVVGANGCGKSTFLKTLLNILQPIAGEIILNQKQLKSYSSTELAQMQSVVLTEKLPPSNLTCKELITLGRTPYTNWHGYINENDEKIINEVIDDLDLSNLLNKNHDELSDGQLQRTLIARALVQDTPFIILDEPTTYLDLAHQFQLMKLLKNLVREKNKCVIFSTHAIELAIEHCDCVLCFTTEGNFFGSPKNLVENETINKLFEKDGIVYNQLLKKFVFHSI